MNSNMVAEQKVQVLYVDGKGEFGIPLNIGYPDHGGKMSYEVVQLYKRVLKEKVGIQHYERIGNRIFVWFQKRGSTNNLPLELIPQDG